MFTKLLIYKLKIDLFNILFRDKINIKISTTLFIFLVIIIFFIIYLFARSFFFFILTQFNYFDTILPIIFFIFFIILLISSISICLSKFYYSSDISLLLTLPLNIKDIFLIKFLEAFISNSVIFLLFGLPIILAHIHTFPILWLSYSPFNNLFTQLTYHCLLLLVIILFLSIPVSIGVLFSLLIIRFLPIYRAKEIFAAIGVIFGGIFYLFYYIFWMRNIPTEGIPYSFEFMKNPVIKFLPSTLAANSLNYLVQGDIKLMLFNLLLLIFISLSLFLMTVNLTKKVYYVGLSKSVDVSYPYKKLRRKEATFNISNPILSLITKDFKIITRDLRLLSMLLFPLIFLIPCFLIFPEMDSLSGDKLPNFFDELTILLLLPFVTFMISSFLPQVCLSTELKSYWIILSSAVKPYIFYISKFIICIIPSIILSILFLLIFLILFKPNILLIIGSFFIVSFFIIGNVGLTLGLSIYFSNFFVDEPPKMISPLGGLVILILDFIFIGINGLILGLSWLSLKYISSVHSLTISFYVLFAGAIIFIIFNILTVLISSYIGLKKLTQLECE